MKQYTAKAGKSKYHTCKIFSQISHKIFQKNIDTKFNIRIKRWFAVKQAPSWGGKSQTAQGERSVTLGISPLNSHNDSHRVDSVSLETDGIVVAMTYPENHCIGEYAIPYRNAISVNAGLKQCCSMSYPGLRFAHPGLSDSCRPDRAGCLIYLRFYGRHRVNFKAPWSLPKR